MKNHTQRGLNIRVILRNRKSDQKQDSVQQTVRGLAQNEVPDERMGKSEMMSKAALPGNKSSVFRTRLFENITI